MREKRRMVCGKGKKKRREDERQRRIWLKEVRVWKKRMERRKELSKGSEDCEEENDKDGRK